MALDEQGQLVGSGDLATQTQQAYRNVYVALKALGATFADIAKLTVYAVDLSPDKMEPLLAGARRASEELGFDYRRPVTLIGVTALANPDYLIEVEALAIVS
jgi:enamine deaminase RidA (YjgF/YER057c/UK114 family)